jgi:hypothetical protein
LADKMIAALPGAPVPRLALPAFSLFTGLSSFLLLAKKKFKRFAAHLLNTT